MSRTRLTVQHRHFPIQFNKVKIVLPFILTAIFCCAGEIPKTLISEDEFEPIHSAIVRKEAWTVDAVRRLRAEAEKQMKEGPWSVTTDRPQNIEIDPHDYYSEASANPDRFLANKTALDAMSNAVFALGTGAFFLDDPRYAKRAARVVRTWFLDPKTRMSPDLEYARGEGVIDGRTFIRAIQGMEFLAQSGNWDPKEQTAVRRWFAEYLQWLTESDNAEEQKFSGDYRASWWAAQTAAVATFVENAVVRKMVFNFYREQIFPRQIRSDGSAPKEESRTKSLWSSAFNLEAMVTICRIAQVHGVDLWQVRGRNNATIVTVIDYLQPYLTAPHKLRKEQASDLPNGQLDFLAFAGMGMKRPEFVSLFRRLERREGAWLSLVDLVVSRWEASAHQTRH